MNYQDKNVVITGGLGFLGLNLVQALKSTNASVKILTRSQHPHSLKWLGEIGEGMKIEVYRGDIRGGRTLYELLDGADVIFNLAGRSGAAKSLAEASKDMNTNIAGHLNVLESLRMMNQKARIIFISSRLVYGVTGSQSVAEDFPPAPTSIYGLHKLSAEHYYRLYYLHYGIPYTIFRLTNPYGPFQDPNRDNFGIVNRFIMSAIRRGVLEVYGGGDQLRDYIYVGDVVDALLCAALAEVGVNKIWNLGFGVSISLNEMATRIVDLAGAGSVRYIPWPVEAEKVETGDFICDTSQISKELSWEPKIQLEEGLVRTVEMYRTLLRDLP